MVSSARLEALADPTSVLIGLFDGDLQSFPHNVSSYFSSMFAELCHFEEIPALNVQNPPETYEHRSLVRFRAMVQDTSLSQEIYVAKRRDGSPGGWGLGDVDSESLSESHPYDIESANLRECHVIWAVSVPGESQWCSDSTGQQKDTEHPTTKTLDSLLNRRPHKFPLPGAPHVGVQVKIYDLSLELYRPTELINFVGILSSEPCIADVDLPSVTLVPTLHVLFSKPVPSSIILQRHSLPTLQLTDLRQELIDWIADEALAGDKNAAEWILLCAIARVQSKNPPILPPPITLSDFPPPPSSTASPTLSAVLSLVFPLLASIPISLHVLNETSFHPYSKNDDLHSGWLQLPRHAVCLITEIAIVEGEVHEKGLLNIRAIQEMMDSQSLQYTFPYSRFVFDTDVSFLVLTEGHKSTFFQTFLNVPLRPRHDMTEDKLRMILYKPTDAIKMPSKERLEAFRQLICGAKAGNATVPQDTAQYIQDDFVRERKAALNNDVKGLTADDLVHHILIARLYTLSLQRSNVTIDIWESVKELEKERKARLMHIL
ncbi:hypothetical protein AX17_003347 [Amanita inopinata Kibby_2008]|nr:hypothetical protein AX17_003347 [Amanita inopinata Kibby_2008]